MDEKEYRINNTSDLPQVGPTSKDLLQNQLLLPVAAVGPVAGDSLLPSVMTVPAYAEDAHTLRGSVVHRVVHRGKIYFFGGFNSREGQHFNDLHCYDPATRQWGEVKPLGEGPCPRRRQSCCVVGTKMFLFGGTSPNENYNEAEDPILGFADHSDRSLKDHNDLHVLDLEPSLKTLSLLRVQALKDKLDISWLPRELQLMLEVMRMPNNITRPLNHTG
ncbi:kelch domain-containing protein 3-like [Macrobrachium nipponense]|uniref:kelch domain-containing protein 3-like n=1 Tax=Macrobrachium nipponense TaxID=159736 RepID=UPI0030C7C45D